MTRPSSLLAWSAAAIATLILPWHMQQDGLTLVPLSLYFKDSRVKVELGLCKGKKLYDKRDADAQRSAKREIDRTIKEKNY